MLEIHNGAKIRVNIKIIGAFLFDDSHEKDVLVAKILTEQKIVSSWVVVQQHFNFKGAKKQPVLEQILEDTPELQDFRKRISVITVKENIYDFVKVSPRKSALTVGVALARRFAQAGEAHSGKSAFEELKYLATENFVRDVALSQVMRSAGGDAWIMVTDVDEILLTDEESTRNLLEATKRGSLFLNLRRKRFVYDFDNSDPQIRVTPLVHSSMLDGTRASFLLSSFRQRLDGTEVSDSPNVVEYSWCYSAEGIMKKFDSYSHRRLPRSVVNRSLLLNHHTVAQQLWAFPEKLVWYRKTSLSSFPHPPHVGENFAELRTHNINPNFDFERELAFPEYFRAPAQP